MRLLRFIGRAFRYALRLFEWATGRRHYPWSSAPPHRLFALIANRTYGWTGARYRAAYALAGGLLKYRERLYGDRINFGMRLGGVVNARTLLNASLWEHAVLASPPSAPRAHVNIHVDEADNAQLDRLLSLLLMSEPLGSINLFFDGAAAAAARATSLTIAEERRGWHSASCDLRMDQPVTAQDLDTADWSRIFSDRTGFDRNVNNYLKVTHPGAFVIALGLPESDDGFCDQWLPAWREALQAAQWPMANIAFIVLNRVDPDGPRARAAASGPPLAFASMAGLTFAEAICLARRADAFIGQMDAFGLAARSARRPGVYLGRNPNDLSDPERGLIHAEHVSPKEACARLQQILMQLAQAPKAAANGGAGRLAGVIRRSARDARGRKPLLGQYSLLIPTYNRPQMLQRLLGWIAHAGLPLSVMVLDSSKPEIQEENKRRIAAAPFDVQHATFPETIDPYVKMRDGLRRVSTPFCSICADDDLAILTAVQDCIEELERDGKAGVAHGYYFNFNESETFNLSYVVYRGKSLADAEPLARLRSLFANYEALIYGVFRADIARRAFRDVDKMDGFLGKELLTAALTIIAGKALRIPDFYYGRSTGESQSYTAWHPHQILAHEPPALFAQYPLFRSLLLEALHEAEPGLDPQAAARTIDLILLRYLEPYLRRDVLDTMIDMNMRGRAPDAIVAKIWDVFVRTRRRGHPVEPLLGAGDAYAPDQFGAGRPRDYQLASRTAEGKSKTYMMYYEFLFPDMRPPALANKTKLLALLRSLDAF